MDRRLAEVRIFKEGPPVHPTLRDGLARKVMNPEKRPVEGARCRTEPFEDSNAIQKHSQYLQTTKDPKAPEELRGAERYRRC